MYVNLNFTCNFKKRALIDTGACANAMPTSVYDSLYELLSEKPTILTSNFSSVKLASGKSLNVLGETILTFQIFDETFTESVLVLPTMNSIVLGNPFFTKHNVSILPAERILKYTDLTLQLNEMKHQDGVRCFTRTQQYKVLVPHKVSIPANSFHVLFGKIDQNLLTNFTGIFKPSQQLATKTDLIFADVMTQVENKHILYQFLFGIGNQIGSLAHIHYCPVKKLIH